MPESNRVLVIGRAGWLGRAVWAHLEAGSDPAYGPPRGELDVTDAALVALAFDACRPTVVLNLAAARPDAGEDTLRAVNVNGARFVAELCASSGARLVHVSSDMVLDGRTPPYADDAKANALTPYGRSKARGEAAVLAANPATLCVRTSLIFDPGTLDRGTATFARRLRRGEPCRLFTDEIRCPIGRDDLARALCDLVGLPVTGTLNVAGREAMSRHEFALRLLRHFDVAERERVQAVRAEDLERGGAGPRPRDLRLLVHRAEHLLGYPLPGVTEVLRSAS